MVRGQWRRSVRQFLDTAARRGRRSGHRPDRRPQLYRPWFEILEGRLAPTVTLSISNPAPFPKPDTGQMTGMFVVTRSGDLEAPILVDYTTQDGSGAQGAHAGIDYAATAGTLVFAPYQITATVTVHILGNNIFQADKTFTVSLSNPRPGAYFAPQRSFAIDTHPECVAVGDFNGDGKLDVVLTENNGPARLLRNDNELKNHWVRLTLVGDGKRSNRSAIGAQVTVEAGGMVLRRQVQGARGYLSQSELPVTVGLGDTARVDRVTVRWPGKDAGPPEVWTDLEADRAWELHQGEKSAHLLR